MRWILIILLMCNGIYYLWHNYMLKVELPTSAQPYSNAAVNDVSTQIALLNELDVSEIKEIKKIKTPIRRVETPDVDVEQQKTVAADIIIEEGVCWLIGPFNETLTAKQVVSRMEALQISLPMIDLKVDGPSDYWVHLPPHSSRRVAIKVLKKLQDEKIDSFLITKGELGNGISLGFFTRKDLALQVFNKRVKQGYAAKIKEVPRSTIQVWAVFDTGQYGDFTDDLWNVVKEGISGLQRQKNYCDKIASKDDLD